MARDREGIQVIPWNLMMLEQVLRVPQVPPNIRVIHAAASEDEHERGQQHGEHH